VDPAGTGLVHHDGMRMTATDRIRAATAADAAQLLRLWALVFDQDDPAPATTWNKHAQQWFTRLVEDRAAARFPVIEVDGDVVATAIGTLELGVPNPQMPSRTNGAARERHHLTGAPRQGFRNAARS
jgi:hypothetical protein